MLEVFGEPGSGLGATGGLGSDHRNREAQEHARDGGVDAGLVDEYPSGGGQRDEQPPGADPALCGEPE